MYPDSNSLGDRKLPLERPAPSKDLPNAIKQPEFFRFESGPAMFVGLNIPGSRNGLTKHIANDFNAQRAQHCIEWLDDSMRVARTRGLSGLVVLFHANINFKRASVNDGSIDHLDRSAPYAWVRHMLVRCAVRFPGTILVLHGDSHRFINDYPFTKLAASLQHEHWGVPLAVARARIARVVRVQSFGWPLVARHIIVELKRNPPTALGDPDMGVLVATRVITDTNER